MLGKVLRFMGLAKPDEGRSAHWPALRKRHLASEPNCIVCGGKDHLTVHHIRPFHLYPELELDPKNLATMCEHPSHNCHLIWGHFLSFRESWNPNVRRDATAYFAKLQSRPTGREAA